MLHWYNWFFWWWARGCSKHVENWNKHIEKDCASSWLFTKNPNKMHGQQNIYKKGHNSSNGGLARASSQVLRPTLVTGSGMSDLQALRRHTVSHHHFNWGHDGTANGVIGHWLKLFLLDVFCNKAFTHGVCIVSILLCACNSNSALKNEWEPTRKVKGKAVPLQAWIGPEGSRK